MQLGKDNGKMSFVTATVCGCQLSEMSSVFPYCATTQALTALYPAALDDF